MASPALYKASKNLTVPYQASAPFSTWMGKAELVLSAKSCGCCGEPIAATDIPAKTLDLTPKEKVTFRPLFAFVTPKAELVKHREIKGSAYIDFPVNRTELYPDYRRNPAELAKINATIDSVRLDKDAIQSHDNKGIRISRRLLHQQRQTRQRENSDT